MSAELEVETPPELEKLEEALLHIYEEFDKEDTSSREARVKKHRFREYFWRGIQNIYWNEYAQDWTSAGAEEDVDDQGDHRDLYDDEAYDRILNLYKSFGLAVIAPLSSAVPHLVFFPEDADDPSDITTAKAYEQINKFLDRHNDAEGLMFEAFYTMYNQDLLFGYTYFEEDKKHGIHREKVETGQMDPVGNPVVEYREFPKGRQIIEIYGSLHVKVPSTARKFENCPYLILETEHHVTELQALYPEHAEKIQGGAQTGTEDYNRWARSTLDNSVESDASIVTLRQMWLRPAAYYVLYKNDKYDIDHEALEQLFPKGLRATFVGEHLIDVEEEDVDEHWEVLSYPFSQHIHGQAIGDDVIPVHEMENDVIDITIETARQGIPINIVDKKVVNYEDWEKGVATPGATIPAVRESNENLGNAFHSFKPAMLSGEVLPFESLLMQKGHFLSGAMPSVIGANPTGGSQTLGEYQMSQSNSLQRLSPWWKIFNKFWANLKNKACRMFAENLRFDEKFTEKKGEGYVNSWIRLSELDGEIGQVVSESSDKVPLTWVQVASRLEQLMQQPNNPMMQVLMHPNNLGFVSNALGFRDLEIPGEGDRNKQLREIKELLKGQATPPDQLPPEMSQMAGINYPIPSVMPDKEFDEHNIHMMGIKAWATTIEGQDARVNNPKGYENVMAHYYMHKMALAALQAQQESPEEKEGPKPVTTEEE